VVEVNRCACPCDEYLHLLPNNRVILIKTVIQIPNIFWYLSKYVGTYYLLTIRFGSAAPWTKSYSNIGHIYVHRIIIVVPVSYSNRQRYTYYLLHKKLSKKAISTRLLIKQWYCFLNIFHNCSYDTIYIVLLCDYNKI